MPVRIDYKLSTSHNKLAKLAKASEKLNIWFTSDTHAYHPKICRGTSDWQDEQVRPFDNAEDMTTAMVESFNKYVGPDDILFHLGDWSFGGYQNIWEFRKRLNCTNIYLSYGNHDHHIEEGKSFAIPEGDMPLYEGLVQHPDTDGDGLIHTQLLFNSCRWYTRLSIDGQIVILHHFPYRSWEKSDDGAINLYGHCHSHLDWQKGVKVEYGKSMDVGVDVALKMFGELRPFKWEEIKQIMKDRQIIVVDHHDPNIKR